MVVVSYCNYYYRRRCHYNVVIDIKFIPNIIKLIIIYYITLLMSLLLQFHMIIIIFTTVTIKIYYKFSYVDYNCNYIEINSTIIISYRC